MGALSKGCGLCKRRKVKCDETHPKCLRCYKAGIECTGFAPRLKFVDEESRIRRRSIKAGQNPSHECPIESRSSQSASHSSRFHRSWLPNSAPTLGNPLSLAAFKDDITLSYLLSKFFEEDDPYLFCTGQSSQCGLPSEWIQELDKNGQKPRYKSWDALAAIVFCQAHNSYDMMRSALRLYGEALYELRSELSNPENWYTDSTLASITALYLYEMFAYQTDKGWIWHANGLAWLLEHRGPWQQKFYAGKAIFLEHRIMLIARSIVLRQSTFLQNIVWKTVPWEDDLASKSAIDYLIDIGTDIVGYLAQSKTNDVSKSSQEINELKSQLAISLEELNTWWHQRGAEHAQTVTEILAIEAIRKPLFLTLLEYDTIWTAFTICTYNAIRILLLQLWDMLQVHPNSAQSVDQGGVLDIPNSTALLGITSDAKGLASEILRSLTYCYSKSRRFIKTFTFLFIQDVAYSCFDKDSGEAKWVIRHGWAELVNFDDIEHHNLLKQLLPSGHLKVGHHFHG